jgi:uncharacterized protein involved in exopolysaccharide biosynthesis
MNLRIYINYFILCAFAYVLSFLGLKFFVPQKYVIETEIFPSATNNPQYSLDYGMRFGDERELNELIVLMNSKNVLFDLIEKSRLDKKYRIQSKNVLVERIQSNLVVSRTLNKSLQVSYYDSDPKLGILVVQNYLDLVWKRQSKLMFNNLYQQKDTLDLLFEEKAELINELKDSLALQEQNGATKVVGLTVLKSPTYRFLERRFESEMDRFNEISKQRETMDQIIRKGVPRFHVVSEPVASEGPVKPKKTVISGLIAFATFLVLLLYRNRDLLFLGRKN